MKPISTIVRQIHAETVAHALIWSTVTNVFAKFHTPDEIVTTNLIHANQIVARMALNAHQAQIIRTFRAVAHLDTLDAYAIKILMNVLCLHHAAMELHAKIFPAHINACVLKAMKAEIVQ